MKSLSALQFNPVYIQKTVLNAVRLLLVNAVQSIQLLNKHKI